MTTFHQEITVQCRDESDAIQRATVKVEVRVDVAKIAFELGHKALRNKSKRSSLGGVTVEVLRDIPKGWKRTGY